MSEQVTPEELRAVYIPHGFENALFHPRFNTEAQRVLQWMEQKDALGQDLLIVNTGGPLARWLMLHYAATRERPLQYVALTRDTTDSDLKQRRELKAGGQSDWADQPVVQAAVHGRLLVLEGLDKAERNVLPVLNNLLENRELPLDDGRWLVPPNRTATSQFIPIGASFRVLSICLPVPPFSGQPLDPPLRSRFQGARVPYIPTQCLLAVSRYFCAVSDHAVSPTVRLLSFRQSLRSIAAHSASHASAIEQIQLAFQHLPPLGEFGILSGALAFELFPDVKVMQVLHWIYPYKLAVSNEEAQQVIEKLVVPLAESDQDKSVFDLVTVESTDSVLSNYPSQSLIVPSRTPRLPVLPSTETENDVRLVFQIIKGGQVLPLFRSLRVRGGGWPIDTATLRRSIENTKDPQKRALCEMLQSHAAQRDICLVGSKGVGKSFIVGLFAKILGFSVSDNSLTDPTVLHSLSQKALPTVEIMFLYKDMTTRDLLQRRGTNSRGETTWQSTPLVRAMLKGGLAILDGIHRLSQGTIAVLGRLVQDRELTLFDGSQFVRFDRYESIKKKLNRNDEFLQRELKLFPIHPCFRLVTVAQPPEKTNPWLTVELMQMFHFHSIDLYDSFDVLANPLCHTVPSPETEKIRQRSHAQQIRLLLNSIVSPQTDVHRSIVDRLTQLTLRVFSLTSDPAIQWEQPISLRQLIRIARQSFYQPTDVYDVICRSLMERFMPQHRRDVLHRILKESGFSLSTLTSSRSELSSLDNTTIQITPVPESTSTPGLIYQLRIGKSDLVNVYKPLRPELVPDVLFYDIPKHVMILESMLHDFLVGEHLLLIGNQGVGKNKLADRLLQLLQRERMYIQLHRDTTVSSLTILPTLRNGVLIWEDSPLVQAMLNGYVLVIDEADKAPTEVVCILKALLEDGEILLADGRRFISTRSLFFSSSNLDRYIDFLNNSQTAQSHTQFKGEASSVLDGNPAIFKIHPDFQIIAMANRPGYPFLGNDFFSEMGDAFSCYAIDNPDQHSEIELLRQYGPQVDYELLVRLTSAFNDLRSMTDEGLLSYPYSTRELVQIVRHLQRFPSDNLAHVLRNVFDFDSFDQELHKTLSEVFERHGIPFYSTFDMENDEQQTTSDPKDLDMDKKDDSESQPSSNSNSDLFGQQEKFPRRRLHLSEEAVLPDPTLVGPLMQEAFPDGNLPLNNSPWFDLPQRVLEPHEHPDPQPPLTPSEIKWNFLTRDLFNSRTTVFSEELLRWSHKKGRVVSSLCLSSSSEVFYTPPETRPADRKAKEDEPIIQIGAASVSDPRGQGLHFTNSSVLVVLTVGPFGLHIYDLQHATQVRHCFIDLTAAIIKYWANDLFHPEPSLVALSDREVLVFQQHFGALLSIDIVTHQVHCFSLIEPDATRPEKSRLQFYHADYVPVSLPLSPHGLTSSFASTALSNEKLRLEPLFFVDTVMLFLKGRSRLTFVHTNRNHLDGGKPGLSACWIDLPQYIQIDAIDVLGLGRLLIKTAAGQVYDASIIGQKENGNVVNGVPSIKIKLRPIVKGFSDFNNQSQMTYVGPPVHTGFQKQTVIDEIKKKYKGRKNWRKPNIESFTSDPKFSTHYFVSPDIISGTMLLYPTVYEGGTASSSMTQQREPFVWIAVNKRNNQDSENSSSSSSSSNESFDDHDPNVQKTKPRAKLMNFVAKWLNRSQQLITISSFQSEAILEIFEPTTNVFRSIHLNYHRPSSTSNRTQNSVPVIIEANELADGRVVLIHSDGMVRVFELRQTLLLQQLESWNKLRGNRAAVDRGEKRDNSDKNDKGSGESGGSGGEGGEGDGGSGGSGSNGSGGGGGSGGSGGGGGGSVLEDMEFNVGDKNKGKIKSAPGQMPNLDDEALRIETEKILKEAMIQAKQAVVKKLDASQHKVGITNQLYEKLFQAVSKEITQLRVILEGVEAKERERVWVKLQTYGELDENRLIDGATGEKAIYKRRTIEEPQVGMIQKRPKRLRFVMDVSSSMAHFNNSDRRLDRMAASTVMIMESFKGFEHKYDYSIVGHDGETPLIPFVDFGKAPKTLQDRMQVIDMMYWNAMFCMSGDHTLSAAHLAINEVIKEEGDDYFVFVLSDANLRAYGITHKALASVLLADPRVNTFALFIAGEDDASDLIKGLPMGHGFVCMDTSKLPKIFKDIFASALMKGFVSKL